MEQQDPLDLPDELKRQDARYWGSNWILEAFEAVLCNAVLPNALRWTIYHQDYPDQAIASFIQIASHYNTVFRVAIGQIRPQDGSFVPYYASNPVDFCNMDPKGDYKWTWTFRVPGHDEYTVSLSNMRCLGSTPTAVLTCNLTQRHKKYLHPLAVDPLVRDCLPKFARVILR